jgi:Fe-S-cluster containining protein
MAADESLADRGSRLCMACGLCCDGALHNAGVLLPEEVPVAFSRGMNVSEAGAEARFALPCPMLKDRCCTIYAGRPRACRNYKCRLLMSLDAGENSLEECLDKVRNARSLVRKLQDILPRNVTLPEARASTASQPIGGDVGKIEKAEIKLHAFALSVYLEKYFRNDYENSFLQSTSVNENNG